MTEVTLDQVTQLAHQLPADDLRKLASIIDELLAAPAPGRQPRSLRGIWQGHFPEDLDVMAAIREIRDQWKEDLEEGGQ